MSGNGTKSLINGVGKWSGNGTKNQGSCMA